MLEERIELLENTLENPAATGVTGTSVRLSKDYTTTQRTRATSNFQRYKNAKDMKHVSSRASLLKVFVEYVSRIFEDL